MKQVPDSTAFSSSLVRLAGVSLVVVAALVAMACWPMQQFGGVEGVRALIAAAVIALSAGWLGTALTLFVVLRDRRQGYAAIVLGLFARFVFTLGPAVALLAAGFGPKAPFLLSVAAAKLVVLGVDTLGLVRVVARAEAAK